MVTGPLVALAIPGVLLVLVTAPLSASLAEFLAGGTDLVLAVLVAVVEAFASLGWASVGVSRGWVLAAAVGIGGATLSLGGGDGSGPGSPAHGPGCRRARCHMATRPLR